MISMTFKGDPEVKELLRQVMASGRNTAPAFNPIAQKVRGDTLANFRGGGVFPGPWAPSKRVQKRGGQTLVDTAILRNSIHGQSGHGFARVGTDVIYAAIHQLGGDITMPARNQVNAFRPGGKFMSRKKAMSSKAKSIKIWAGRIGAHTIHIPARPFLPVDAQGNLAPATSQFVVKTLADFIMRGAA